MAGATETGPEVSAGLFRAAARHSVRPAGQRRPAAERGGARSPVRRVADHGRAGGAGPAGGRPRRAAGRVRHVRQERAEIGRPVVRPAHPGSRRHGDLRADLPGDDGVAARGRARAGVGQHHHHRVQAGRRVAAVPAVHRAPGLGGVLRAARARGGKRRRQRAHRARAGRRRHPRRPARPHGRALSAARASRPRRHRQPARRLRHHRAPVDAWRAADRVRRAAQCRGDRRRARGGFPRSALCRRGAGGAGAGAAHRSRRTPRLSGS